jgi:hypothetical protein
VVGIVSTIVVAIGIDLAIALPRKPSDRLSTEARDNIAKINRYQVAYKIEHYRFANTFDLLTIDNFKGRNRAKTANFHYRIALKNNVAIAGAKPVHSQDYGYNGAAIEFKNSANLTVMTTIVCKSKLTGADGTNLNNAPIATLDGDNTRLKCAPGWVNLNPQT